MVRAASVTVAAAVSVWLAAHATATPGAESRLERQLAAVERQSGGDLGFAAIHLETGATVARRGGERFQMMSVFKLPIALALLDKADRGGLSLDTRLTIAESDLRPGLSPIAERHPRGGMTMTARELLEAMVVQSDNTACDRLVAFVGGPGAVAARMRQLGVPDVDVSVDELGLWQSFAGVEALGPRGEWSLAHFEALASAVAPERRTAASRAFASLRPNTATPEAMARLLVRVYRGEALGKDSTLLLLDMLKRTLPAAHRIKGGLPSGTLVYHRPGTSGTYEGLTPATNDVGIVELPDGTHVALAIFVRNSARSGEVREGAIARAARAAYDAWSQPRERRDFSARTTWSDSKPWPTR
ncbi:MAG: class A beta-lactamase [Betaproteobacteria bacterium]